MNNSKKYSLISYAMVGLGIFLVFFGSSEVTEAREIGDAMLLAEGFNDEMCGTMFMFLSVLILFYSYFEDQIRKLRKALNETKNLGETCIETEGKTL